MDQEKIETRIAILVYLPETISATIQKTKEDTQSAYTNHETKTPHITLYSCKFDETRFSELVSQIRGLNLKPFPIKLDRVEITTLNKGGKKPIASVEIEDEFGIRKIHEEVLSVANSLRGDLVREKDVERFKKGLYSDELYSFIKEYGYEHVKENFTPHITIGEIEINDISKLESIRKLLEPAMGKEILVDKLHILLSARKVPSEEKIKESEVVEIALNA